MKTQTQDKATARPWSRQGFTVFRQCNPGGRKLFICDVSQDAGAAVSPANAALIVEAVNEHAALVAVAEAAKNLCEQFDLKNKWEVSTAQFFSAMQDGSSDIKKALANLAAAREGKAQ